MRPLKIMDLARWLLFIVAILSFPASASQAPRLEFEEISIDEGLSQSIVECVIQDRRGFLWFGTESGLNKYDGYDFTIIVHDPEDPNSLSYNHILSIGEDSEGYIWIGTFHGGLNRFNPNTGEFKLYVNDPEDPFSLSSDYIGVIYEDSDDVLWIGTGNGLNRYNRNSDDFTLITSSNPEDSSLFHTSVLEIFEDRAGMLWIGHDGGGLSSLDRERNATARYLHDPSTDTSLSNNHVRAICEDNLGTLWIGTVGGGLNRFDRSSGRFTSYANDPSDPRSLSHDQVFSLYVDPSGALWIGTNGGGLDLYDRKNDSFFNYRNDPNDLNSLSYDEIYDIMEDRSGVIWLGTYGGGTNKFNRKRKRFDLFKPDPNDPNSLSNDIVWSIMEDNDGILWVGTHGGGLNRIDRQSGSYRHYRHDPSDPYSIPHDIVRLVFIDRSGTFWLGTHGGGISRFDPASGRFYTMRHDPDDPNSLSHNEIRTIYEDSKGFLWIGTYGGGLNRYDRESGVFTAFRSIDGDANSLRNDFIRVIHEDGSGDFWIGTQGGGLAKFDRESGRFTHHVTIPGDAGSLSNNYVFSIFVDSKDRFWIGTMGGGLNLFDRSTGRFRHFTEDNGLSNNSVYCILEDDNGHLWLSTNYGLSRFDPQTETFKNYSSDDGLQSNEFNGGSAFKSSSGELFFGGINGLNAFFPGEIEDNPHVPPVVITRFLKLNIPVDMDRPLSEIDELVLSHRDYIFSFEFSALDFTAPEKNRYAYMMEGLDDRWIYTGADKRFATYTTLAPGEYVFKVKGTNNDGLWNDEAVSVRLTITPPFWQEAWFRISVVVLVLGTVLLVYRWRLNSVRINTELQAAHHAQMSIMPHMDPQVDGFDISGACIPAYEVGGDFYDYIWMNDDKTRFGIAIGDVSGKAMKAAMIAVMSSGMIYSKATETESLARIMTDLNSPIFSKTDPAMFTTLCLAAIDLPTRKLSFTNAGFNDPILKSNGSVASIECKGSRLPLGMIEKVDYSENSLQLKPGDVLVMFSDGIPDSLNHSQEFYDVEALESLLRDLDTKDMTAGDIKDTIVNDVKRFSGTAPQHDDMTLVVIKTS